MWMNDEPPVPSEYNGHHSVAPTEFSRHRSLPGCGWIYSQSPEWDVWIVKVLPNYLAIVEFKDGVRTCIDWRGLWCDCQTG